MEVHKNKFCNGCHTKRRKLIDVDYDGGEYRELLCKSCLEKALKLLDKE